MAEDKKRRRSPLTLLAILFFGLVFPLSMGVFLAPKLMPSPKIGIIRLNYDIYSETANEINAQLAYAREHPEIQAVVLVLNSPGGSAAYSEELYMNVLYTRKKIPVIATVDLLAASGAYYMAAGANEIYAKPTSSIGSVGVIAFLPGDVFIEDDLLTTGPYKAFGGTRDSMIRQIEMAKFAFLEAVAVGRGDRLKISLEYLSRAEIYTGIQAVDMGLIDGLKSTDEAIFRAAELAGLNSYSTVELYPLAFPETVEGEAGAGYATQVVDAALLWAPPEKLPAGLYYRYLELPSNR